MKLSNALLLGAGIYGLYYYTTLGVAADTIKVIFTGIDLINITTFRVHLMVQNITNATVTVQSMTGDLLLNGDQLADLSDFTPRDIAPNGESQIDVLVSPSLLSLPGTIKDLLNSTGSNLNFTATGNINISGLPIIPFTLDKTVQVL